MKFLALNNRQPGDDTGISEEGIILPAPDACSDWIVRICRYGLYAFVMIAIAAVLYYAAKG